MPECSAYIEGYSLLPGESPILPYLSLLTSSYKSSETYRLVDGHLHSAISCRIEQWRIGTRGGLRGNIRHGVIVAGPKKERGERNNKKRNDKG